MRYRYLTLFSGTIFLLLAILIFFISPVQAGAPRQVASQTPAPTVACEVGGDELCVEEGVTPAPSALGASTGLQLAPQPQNKAVLYMFWGEGCPHCAEAKPALEQLARVNPGLEVIFYEIYYDETNLEYFFKMADEAGFEPTGVPTIFLGDQYWVGYNEIILTQIESALAACMVSGCPDSGVGIIPGRVEIQSEPSTPVEPPNGESSTGLPSSPDATTSSVPQTADYITLPIIGKVDLANQSLFISTFLIGLLDGFNPCSFWVLTMLLAITMHTGSRKKVVVIGLVFLTITAAVYALFIVGLFTVFSLTSKQLAWIQVVVALAALFFALVNIKDYFWYKEGLSFTIDDSKKPGLYMQMRKLSEAGQSWWGLISGTVILAGGVSLVEFSCTAGFPVLWTNLLLTQQVTTLSFVLLLLVYMFVYQLIGFGIFFTAVFTLKANRLEEKHGRILKLIGGMLMLTLAIVMLVKPDLMNKLSSSLIIFGIAFGVTLLVFLLHQVILPRLGIRIGTVPGERRRKKRSHSHTRG